MLPQHLREPVSGLRFFWGYFVDFFGVKVFWGYFVIFQVELEKGCIVGIER